MQRIDTLLNEGNFYEAQQLCTSLSNRAVLQKQYARALEMLQKCAVGLLAHQQLNSAGELAQQYLNVVSQHRDVQSDQQTLSVVRDLARAFGDKATPSKIDFLKAAIKLFENDKSIQTELYGLLADSCALSGLFDKAQTYYLRSDKPKQYASMLVRWAQQGYPSERDLFVVRAVLLHAARGNLKDANTVFEAFLESSPDLPETPLINFCRFLLLTLERDAYPLFEVLRKKYAESLKRDPTLSAMLDQVCMMFYKRTPASSSSNSAEMPGMMGMMGEMMRSMFSAPPR